MKVKSYFEYGLHKGEICHKLGDELFGRLKGFDVCYVAMRSYRELICSCVAR